MAIDPEDELDESLAKTPTTADPTPSTPSRPRATSVETGTESEEDDDEEEQDDEPRLKYSRLTGSLGAAYRSGDSTSSFLLAGDKMIVGSHSGNINVLTIPSFQPLRSYRAHTASVTSVSISPFPPPWPTAQSVVANRLPVPIDTFASPGRSPSVSSGATAAPRTPRQQPQIPATPSNSIYIATSSIDGHVCVQSLVDSRDVMLRNFARPVNSVALSPEYKNDRTYISGGLAGNLILTVGGKAGISANANTNSAAAAASGWLSSIGIGANTGRDQVLHSGEGTISTVKWSLSGKFVVWVNEHGIKVMRSNIKLDSADADYAWKRIAHIDRPNRAKWEEMAGVWRARADWIDDKCLETDEDEPPHANGNNSSSAASESLLQTKGVSSKKRRVEKLVVGWGDSAWVLHVIPEGAGKGKDANERVIGSATIVHHLLFDDCIISGLSLYTPSLLLVLAYRTRDDNDNPIPVKVEASPRRGVFHRQNGMSPELRLINVVTKEEADVDTLTMKNYESLSAADYHIGTLYVPAAPVTGPIQRGALSVFGEGLWDASIGGAARIFNSGASIRSSGSGDNSMLSPGPGSISTSKGTPAIRRPEINSSAATPGLKVVIHSPYDCVLAVKRDLSDHLTWLVGHHSYKEAWELVDEHPEVVTAPHFEPTPSMDSQSAASTPSKNRESLVDFFADDTASQTTISATRGGLNVTVEQEKRRIGEQWLQQLVTSKEWQTAGQVAGRVLGSSSRWQHWIFTFAKAGRFDEISPYIPPTPLKPPIESLAYEVVLGHYIHRNRMRLKALLDSWDLDLFNIGVITSAIEERLERGDISEDTTDNDGIIGDWRILMDSLAKLYLADNRPKDALKCYIRLQNADSAMQLIRDYHLIPSIADELHGFILLRISKEQLKSAPLQDLEEASSEAIHLLVDEAYQGTVHPSTVVDQLSKNDDTRLLPFLFFYLRALWRGQGTEAEKMEKEKEEEDIPSAKKRARQQRQQTLEAEGHALVDEYADLAVSLFAEYDRPLLMEFLRSSREYAFEKATAQCERRQYWPELVYLLSQTGEIKRALSLIINRLGDVSLAISFAKEQGDPELWDDLLSYSMDKPRFIRGLLEEVGTSIDPIKLVKRIPEGLEIEGLREGIGKMVREYEIQASISDGVARVLRGEVAMGMDSLRKGRAKGVKFEVVHKEEKGVEVEISVDPVKIAEDDAVGAALPLDEEVKTPKVVQEEVEPGHCAGCRELFVEDEKETLIGFACGHVYHLTCLLESIRASNPEMAEAAERLQKTFQRDADAAEDGYGYARSVGAKVAHAHIIRGAVRAGCARCRDVGVEDEN